MRDHQINILTDGEPQASRRVGVGIRPASCLYTESLGSGGIFLGRIHPRSVDVGIEFNDGEGGHRKIPRPDARFLSASLHCSSLKSADICTQNVVKTS